MRSPSPAGHDTERHRQAYLDAVGRVLATHALLRSVEVAPLGDNGFSARLSPDGTAVLLRDAAQPRQYGAASAGRTLVRGAVPAGPADYAALDAALPDLVRAVRAGLEDRTGRRHPGMLVTADWDPRAAVARFRHELTAVLTPVDAARSFSVAVRLGLHADVRASPGLDYLYLDRVAEALAGVAAAHGAEGAIWVPTSWADFAQARTYEIATLAEGAPPRAALLESSHNALSDSWRHSFFCGHQTRLEAGLTTPAASAYERLDDRLPRVVLGLEQRLHETPLPRETGGGRVLRSAKGPDAAVRALRRTVAEVLTADDLARVGAARTGPPRPGTSPSGACVAGRLPSPADRRPRQNRR